MLTLIHKLTNALLQAVTLVLLAGLTGIVVGAVVMRKLGHSFVWYDEVALVLLVWLSYYGAALAALHRGHLSFPGVLFALPRWARLAGLVLGEITVVGFFAMVAWYGWLVLDIVAGEALISLPWLSYSVVHSVIPIGAVLYILAQLVSLPRAWSETRRGGGA